MRKSLLFILALLLVACGAQSSQGQDDASVIEPSRLQVLVAANDFGVGSPRIPLVIYDGPDSAEATAVTVDLYDLASDPPVAIWQGEATAYLDYEVPYWIVTPDIPSAGSWGLGLTVQMADGTTEELPVPVAIAEQSIAPIAGDPAPPSQNRTVADTELKVLSSGGEPNPALYQMTVAEAVESGRPTIVTLATPSFCQTKICAPVVDSVEAVYAQIGADVNYIHLEIYKDFQNLTLADEVEEWALQSEPWTFVIDADGIVVARLGGPVSTQELLDNVEPLLAQ